MIKVCQASCQNHYIVRLIILEEILPSKDIAAIARVHPAAMGLVAYYYRLELAISAFRRVMTRYEGMKVESNPVTFRQFRVVTLLLKSFISVIAEVSKIAVQIRSGI